MNDLTFPNKANSYKIGFHSGSYNWNKYACLRDPIIVGDNRKLYVKYFEYYDGGSYPNASIALAKSTTPGTYYYIPASAYKIFTVGNSQHNQAYYRNLTKDSSWTYTKARDDLDNPAWKIQEIDLESIEQFYLYFGCNNGYFYISDVWMTK